MVKPKLLDQVRYAVRVRHLSYRTEQAYVSWIKQFILFHRKRHPSEMDESGGEVPRRGRGRVKSYSFMCSV